MRFSHVIPGPIRLRAKSTKYCKDTIIEAISLAVSENKKIELTVGKNVLLIDLEQIALWIDGDKTLI